jgi:hypothetical protein
MATSNCGLKSVFQDPRPIPEGKRVPFAADYITLPVDGFPVRLFFRDPDGLHDRPGAGPARLRVVCAMDVRENRKLEVCVNGDPVPVGEFDIRFAYVLQPFDVFLCEEVARDVLANGVRLRMTEGDEDTVIFAEPGDDFLCPRLLYDQDYADREQEFQKRLFSLAGIQPFGWMEGCVLDGLSTLHDQGNPGALAAIRSHLGKYIHHGRLVYEDPRGRICDGTIYGIEAGLPFAVIAKTGEGREVISLFRRFIKNFAGDGIITDAEFVSAEGSYTIAYPLAVLAAADQDRHLAERAIRQLMVRKQRLRVGSDLYLRNGNEGRIFKNWGRAYVWYLMGLVQVFRVFDINEISYPEELLQDFRLVAEIAAAGLCDGLCHVFLGEAETGVETSGSAGIAAALSLACRFGFLDRSYDQVVARTRQALHAHLTPDGMLSGVSQSNRDGERLQRGGYRVISQMAMGLMAHI